MQYRSEATEAQNQSGELKAWRLGFSGFRVWGLGFRGFRALQALKIQCDEISHAMLQRRLYSYFRKHHPGQTPTGFTKPPYASLVASLSEDQEAAWMCKFCSCVGSCFEFSMPPIYM